MRAAAYLFGASKLPGVLVIEGDSIPAGYGLGAGEDWPSRLMVLLATYGIICTLSNVAASGDQVSGGGGMASQAAAQVLPLYQSGRAFAPGHAASSILVLAGGTNDLANGVSEGTLRTAQASEYSAARAAGFLVGGVGILHRTGSFSGGADQTSFNTDRAANIAYWASQVGTLIDFWINPSEEPNLLDPNDAAFWQTATFPGIHPNAAGAQVMADYIAPRLRDFVLST